LFIISAFFILLTATTSPVSMWRHILTSPKAPLPIIDSGSKSLVDIFFLIFLFNSASLWRMSYLINSYSAPDKFNFYILCWRISQAYFLFDSSFLSFWYFDSMYAFALSALSFMPFVIYPAYPLVAAALGYYYPLFYYWVAPVFLPSSPAAFPFAYTGAVPGFVGY